MGASELVSEGLGPVRRRCLSRSGAGSPGAVACAHGRSGRKADEVSTSAVAARPSAPVGTEEVLSTLPEAAASCSLFTVSRSGPVSPTLAETLVRGLLEVGLQLNYALAFAEGPEVRRSLGKALEGVEGSIRDVREAVFNAALVLEPVLRD